MNENNFDINEYFHDFCKKIKITVFQRITNEPSFVIKSTSIRFSTYPDQVEKEVKNAIRSLELSVYALTCSGMNLEIEEIRWHNVKDSCDNIFGDKGFFILKYKKI